MAKQSLCRSIILSYVFSKNKIKEIRQGDANFRMADGIRLVPRAAFEISKSCPHNYKLILADCIDRGWIKPIAYVKEKELFWEVLSE